MECERPPDPDPPRGRRLWYRSVTRPCRASRRAERCSRSRPQRHPVPTVIARPRTGSKAVARSLPARPCAFRRVMTVFGAVCITCLVAASHSRRGKADRSGSPDLRSAPLTSGSVVGGTRVTDAGGVAGRSATRMPERGRDVRYPSATSWSCAEPAAKSRCRSPVTADDENEDTAARRRHTVKISRRKDDLSNRVGAKDPDQAGQEDAGSTRWLPATLEARRYPNRKPKRCSWITGSSSAASRRSTRRTPGAPGRDDLSLPLKRLRDRTT
jgi:hypothetical protein